MLSNLFPPVVSGSSNQCAGLARALAERGQDVVVITARLGSEAPAEERWHGVRVYRLPCLHLPRTELSLRFPWLNAVASPANLRRVRSLLDRHGVELLHVHNHMFDLALVAAWMARRTRRKLIVTVHTIIKHTRPLYDVILRQADRHLLRRVVIRAADRIICPDFNVDAYIRQRFGRRDGTIVPYGVDLPGPADLTEVERQRAEHELSGRRVILSLGHVHALRNRLDLVRAMPLVLRSVPEAVLLVVGSVDDLSPVHLARELGVQHAVRFVGAQPHSRIPAYLALAELEAHWLNQDDAQRTSLGLATMEAMLAGKCCLAAANLDTFGPGVLEDGRHLVIVRPNDPPAVAEKLVGLLKDPQRTRQIGQQARALASTRFSWDAVASRTLEVYQDTRAR